MTDDRTPTTAAGRDYERLNDLRDAIIEAVRAQDGVGGIKAFAAYEDFIEAEARADPRAEGLRAALRPLLSWAEAVSQHHAMLRSEPPFTTTRALKDALVSAYAALAAEPKSYAPPGPDPLGSRPVR